MKLLATLLLFSPAFLSAGSIEPAYPTKPEAQAIHLTQPIKLDGLLSEAVWQRPSCASNFTQRDPKEGEPASESTKVWFAYDDEAFYLGARMYCANPTDIRSLVSRRDQGGISERIIVSLDTYLDRRTAYSFAVTATGTRIDYYHPGDHEHNRDYSFDPVWEAKTHIDSLGWTAEMRIPLSQLRFNDKEEQVWGFNLNRWIPTRNEDDYYVYIPKKEIGWSSRFAQLNGITGIKPSRRLEVTPYASSDATLNGERDKANPFDDGKNLAGRLGADVKMGLGPNMTLDAAVNPDFGQVEADPAQVNLSAFETFFSEKRPFFTEGNQLLKGSGPGYYYSRRIGSTPNLEEPVADYIDRPKTSTILGAAKLTGRLSSGLSLGALTALTAREHTRTFEAAGNTYGRTKVAPLTGYGVFRAQQEFGPSASTVGLSLTGLRRDFPVWDTLSYHLNRQAYSGGGDWNLRFNHGEYELGGFAGFSYIQGTSRAIAAIQNSSAHYFQRAATDAGYLRLDSSRTSLAGYTGSLRLAKNGGKHWLWEVGGSAESPGFELNDVGRLGSADDIEFFGFLRYRETVPGKIFRGYSFAAYPYSGWNFGGTRKYSGVTFEANSDWKNFWNSFLGLELSARGLSDDLTRGGPLMKTAFNQEIWGGLNSNFASRVNWRIFASHGRNDFGHFSNYFEGSLSFRSNSRWEFSLVPYYQRTVTARQYITTLSGGRLETYGNRYIFSFIDQSTLATQFRASYAFTPDLTLELYAEPFAASGHFYNFGELLYPGSRHIRTYGTDGTTISYNDSSRLYAVTDGSSTFTLRNRDFNVISFRSNLVLRWEWRPGSTLYVVWQQDRSGFEPRGDLIRPSRLFDTFSATGNNFFALKISYWIPVS